MDLRSEAEVGTIDSIKSIDLLEQNHMSTSLPRPDAPNSSQPAHDVVPRRLIVTASVVIFALRDWSLWVLLREGPWGPPMRILLGSDSGTESVTRSTLATVIRTAMS